MGVRLKKLSLSMPKTTGKYSESAPNLAPSQDIQVYFVLHLYPPHNPALSPSPCIP